MRWSILGAAVVASALSLPVTVTAQAADPPPPRTLTKAQYHLTNGNTGIIDLATGGDAAEVPGRPTPLVVSLGDSYISGEAGRWAGNSEQRKWSDYTDALGDSAYADVNGKEAIPGCHRAEGAEIHFGGGVTSVNLACSGATTATDASAKPYKPGIDASDTQLHGVKALGQTALLAHLAQANRHRIRLVVLSIGGNDFHFGTIVEKCVKAFLGWGDYCKDNPELQALVDSDSVTARRTEIAGAIGNVYAAMKSGGYRDEEWTMLVQTYPSPVADSQTIRYPQTYARQFRGGCGFYNADLDWANGTVLATVNSTVKAAAGDVKAAHPNLRILDLGPALMGHRLCETGTTVVGKIEGALWGWDWAPVRAWTQKDAAGMSEWVAQIRAVQTGDPYAQEESLHPNYWAQKAYQSCLTEAYGSGTVRGGVCSFAGLDRQGLPTMRVDPLFGWEDQLGELPTLGKPGRGAPHAVRHLRAEDTTAGMRLAWKAPRGKAPVRAYFYHLRRAGHAWQPWLRAGVSHEVVIPIARPGRYRVTVVAQNEHGSSPSRSAHVRLR
ncbi:MAG: hypothetical protein U0R64_05690 [Candidatus Nanopelagicales bacterium]